MSAYPTRDMIMYCVSSGASWNEVISVCRSIFTPGCDVGLSEDERNAELSREDSDYLWLAFYLLASLASSYHLSTSCKRELMSVREGLFDLVSEFCAEGPAETCFKISQTIWDRVTQRHLAPYIMNYARF
eukprot:TRINITY_DN10971_c0_g1_i1.p1 TRINITY_DN10971_c0_g1~~TRINITY_DN10971_c0_g1_i1.p1  ORF type:complete len:130 (-),score=11.33 TRINITY_DN10971_c0_g1_i1:74-463(-)